MVSFVKVNAKEVKFYETFKFWSSLLKSLSFFSDSVTCEKHFVKTLKLKNTTLANIHTFIELLSNLEL